MQSARWSSRTPTRRDSPEDKIMINDITTDTDDGMKKAVDSFKRDLQKIRTGRANTAMLDGIKVDYYSTPTPVNQVATVQVVDARLITVKPWEKAMIAV